MPAPVIMVHGAFCGGWVFEAFKAPFEAAGHRCIAPDLPGHSAGGDPSGLSMTDYATAVADLIREQDEAPIVVGHSLGGLVAQIAAGKAKTAALVLLSPSAPWGVSLGSMEEAAQAIGLMGLGAYWTGAVSPDFGLFSTYSGDRLPLSARTSVYSRMVPESGRALFETLNWWMDPFMTTALPPALGSPPVLVLAGGRDQINGAGLMRQTADRARADFALFEPMSHWLIGEPGYRDVAEAALKWLPSAARAAA